MQITHSNDCPYRSGHDCLCGASEHHAKHGRTIIGQTAIDAEKDATIARLSAELAEARNLIKGYEQWADDVKRLTRQIDVDLHGEEGAAKQASLCDIVGAGVKLRAERDALVAAAYEAAASTKAHIDGIGPSYMPTRWQVVIRALTPTDATAALDRAKADARAEGFKAGMLRAAGITDAATQHHHLCDTHYCHDDCPANTEVSAVILAAASQEAGNV